MRGNSHNANTPLVQSKNGKKLNKIIVCPRGVGKTVLPRLPQGSKCLRVPDFGAARNRR